MRPKYWKHLLAAAILIAGAVALYFVLLPEDDSRSGISASWADHYETAEALCGAADLVITGRVADSTTEIRGSRMVFTRQSIEVLTVHSGTAQPGDRIELLQTGGRHGKQETPAFAEIPLLQPGTEYLLLLEQTEPDPLYGQYYLICGGYQGIAAVAGAKLQPLHGSNAAMAAALEALGLH